MHIAQYWNSNCIPDYILPLVASYKEQNHWANYVLFNEDSAERFLSNNFSDREVAAFRSCAVPAMQADYFRYCAVLALGGAYADADTLCLGSLMPLFDEAFRDGALFFAPNGNVMNAFFLFRSQRSPFLNAALEIATANIENRIAEDVWLTTGPGIFSFMYAIHESGSFSGFAAEVRNHEYERVPPYVDLMCETLGSFGRLSDLLKLVRFFEFTKLDPYIQMHSLYLPYKETDVHWTRSRSSIFK